MFNVSLLRRAVPVFASDDDRSVREQPPAYAAIPLKQPQEIFPENFLTEIPLVA